MNTARLEAHGLAFYVGAAGLDNSPAFAAIVAGVLRTLAAMPAADVAALHRAASWESDHWQAGAADSLFAILGQAADAVLEGLALRYPPFLWIEAQAAQ